jgi:hypothetical protein
LLFFFFPWGQAITVLKKFWVGVAVFRFRGKIFGGTPGPKLFGWILFMEVPTPYFDVGEFEFQANEGGWGWSRPVERANYFRIKTRSRIRN